MQMREIIVPGLSKADIYLFRPCSIYYAYIVCIAALHVVSRYRSSANVIQNGHQPSLKNYISYGAESSLDWLIEIAGYGLYCAGKSHLLRMLRSCSSSLDFKPCIMLLRS